MQKCYVFSGYNYVQLWSIQRWCRRSSFLLCAAIYWTDYVDSVTYRSNFHTFHREYCHSVFIVSAGLTAFHIDHVFYWSDNMTYFEWHVLNSEIQNKHCPIMCLWTQKKSIVVTYFGSSFSYLYAWKTFQWWRISECLQNRTILVYTVTLHQNSNK